MPKQHQEGSRRLSFKLKARNEKGSTEARAIYNVLGIENQKEFLSDLKLVYGASTSETGSILCDKFNVFYGFVWKNEIKLVPLPRQERTRWQDPIIYCSQPFYTKNFLGQFNDCQYWCGDVNAPVVLPHAIHQKTIKKVAGIKGKVDYNILNCKLKEIQL